MAVIKDPHMLDENEPMQFELEQVDNGNHSSSNYEHRASTHGCSNIEKRTENNHKKAKTRPKFHHSNSWKEALKKAQIMPDPWEQFHIDESCPMELAIRHRYNVLKKHWVKDEVRVKMEKVVSNSLIN